MRCQCKSEHRIGYHRKWGQIRFGDRFQNFNQSNPLCLKPTGKSYELFQSVTSHKHHFTLSISTPTHFSSTTHGYFTYIAIWTCLHMSCIEVGASHVIVKSLRDVFPDGYAAGSRKKPLATWANFLAPTTMKINMRQHMFITKLHDDNTSNPTQSWLTQVWSYFIQTQSYIIKNKN